ncbi:glycerate kinase [Lentiprolixibacter aurantiacus]|uniref:Glycerate kinase n=1 Tax=Lentiprolixibacter aurantiacus TaxID=2993939 RepID=A0AAE3MMR8_9FLAO|nr:glycerate kinase [Lentiprolixibacter aurantiacus]MCX2720068.1 glycerate kinase [Lentiprolixibacter aurantiacus]
MNFLLLPDKFKGSLTAKQLIQSLTKGILKAIPGAGFHSLIASDGGDGFLDAISEYRETEVITTETVDPLGRKITSTMLVDPSKGEAYIEMAKASGLVLLAEEERSASKTSSRGTGIQIREAMRRGFRKIYVGLGGSATNDAGMGMAYEVGYRFLDEKGDSLKPIGANLALVHKINREQVIPELRDTRVFAVNDVNNPLYGPFGAAAVYAAQKGANRQEIELLDRGLQHLDYQVRTQMGFEYADLPGTGAAGGAAYGLKCFLNAEFITGTAFILDLAKIPRLLRTRKFDYILTGEGKIDSQTLSGKWINGVMELGRAFEIPVVAICGRLEVSPEELKKAGLTAVIEAGNRNKPLEYNMSRAAELVESAVYKYFKGR